MQTAAALTVFEQTLRAVEEAAFARGRALGRAEGKTEGGGMRLLTLKEVCGMIGMKETSFRLLRAEDPSFPKPKLIELGSKSRPLMMWREHDVAAWIAR